MTQQLLPQKRYQGRNHAGEDCARRPGAPIENLACGLLVLIAGVSCVVAGRTGLAQDQIPLSVYERATASLRQGDPAHAEQVLRSALREHPSEPRALGLLAVVLDAQKRYDEAERYYRQALELSPRSTSLLNNLGNHYLARGDAERARAAFAQVVALEPDHANANLQLAQMSVAEKKGEAALEYLNHLPREDQAAPAAQLLRAQALELKGRRSEAANLLAELEKQTPGDPRVEFSIGMTYVNWKRYEDAERAFTQALEAEPTSFDVLYNLGLAAMRAGHLDRAQEVFEVAVKQRPEDLDTLYNLARVRYEQEHAEQAIALLVQAQRLAPRRPDVLLLMAQAAEKLGYYADSAAALGEYLSLKPSDDVARRERGFALARTAKLDEALPDLRWYVQKHPEDARGFYELGIAETVRERDKALIHLSRAVALDPNLNAACYARAVLNFQGGKPAQAVEDLKIVLEHEPNHYQALDTLGESYLQLGQPEEAARALGRAAELAPNDPKILMHYSRALLRANHKQEASVVLRKIEQIGPGVNRTRPYSGLFDFLSLPATEQRAQYLANVEGRIQMNPKDPSLRVRLGKEQLAQGKIAEALQTFREVLALTSDPMILSDCGKALLDSEQYDAAREFLAVVAADPAASDARLDLAIALFHAAGPEAGLAELDRTPPARRQGDYFLLRAQMLDARGKLEEARESLNRGFRAAPTRPDLYFQAALFLIKHAQYQRAVDLLRQAVGILPDNPELLLTEAIAYGLMDRPEESQKLLSQIESRWPEWSQPYLINGIMLSGHAKFREAKPLLQTAIALGSREAAAYYNLALSDIDIIPADIAGAQEAIRQALRLNPDDPYIQSLAGKVAFARKDYQAALEHLNAALRSWPDMAEAHQTLSATYRALGEKEKSVAELKEVLRIKQQTRTADQAPPFSAETLLFTVRPPRL